MIGGNVITKSGMTAWSTQACSDAPVLPLTEPGDSLNFNTVVFPGQRTSLSLCLRSDEAATVSIEPRKFFGPCKPNLDIRYVLPWIQDLDDAYGRHSPGLWPELLVRDPEFAQVINGKNVIVDPPVDSASLKPIRLKPGETQQIFFTLSFPENATPSRGYIFVLVEKDGARWRDIVIVFDVLPVTLPESPVRHAAFHREAMFFSGMLGSCSKSRYERNVSNMAAHGLKAVISYEDLSAAFSTDGGPEKIGRLLQAHEKSGIRNDPFFAVQTGLPWYSADQSDQLRSMATRMVAFFRDNGVENLYFYAHDDLTPSVIEQRIPMWDVIHQSGGKVFGACGPSNAEAILPMAGGKIDLMMHNDATVNTGSWHHAMSDTALYGPTSWRLPESQYRRRYGLQAYLDGWDWAVQYAWQHQMGGSQSDDTDNPYADHMLVYYDNVDTLQLEAGLVEAQTDAAIAARCDSLGLPIPDPVGRDLDEVRDEMVESILKHEAP